VSEEAQAVVLLTAHVTLQKQVLSLVRAVSRAARTKPPQVRRAVHERLRQDLAASQDVDRSDVARVEFLLRRGHKQLELLRNGAFVGFGVWRSGGG